MAKVWRYWINPILSSVGVILHFWVTLLNPSSKSSFLKFLFLFTLLIPVFLQTLSMDRLPIYSCMIFFLANIILCQILSYALPSPLRSSRHSLLYQTPSTLKCGFTLSYAGLGEQLSDMTPPLTTYYVIKRRE